jgi:hypothetical protein
METLRLALLVTLLALLAYILYKKLLTRMQRGNLVQSYIEFEDPKNLGEGKYRIEVNFPQSEKVMLSLLGPDGQLMNTLLNDTVQSGEQSFDIQLTPGSGKHSLALKSDRQSTECFIQA